MNGGKPILFMISPERGGPAPGTFLQASFVSFIKAMKKSSLLFCLTTSPASSDLLRSIDQETYNIRTGRLFMN